MKTRFCAVFALIMLLVCGFSPTAAADMRVHVLDVGQGDSILIILPSGNAVLVDGSELPYGRRVVVPTLKRLGITELEKVILTHPHSDHLGGLIPVLENIRVKEVWDSSHYNTLTYKRFRELIEEKEIPRREMFRGDTETWEDGITATVLNPKRRGPGEVWDLPVVTDDPEQQADALRSAVNNSSIVIRLTYGNTSIMLTGDAEERAERNMLDSGLTLSAQVLKVGHHGSLTSSTYRFLTAVSPTIAAISVGTGNSYHHPGDATLRNLERMGAAVYRTDIGGTFVLGSDGTSFTVLSGNRGLPDLLERIAAGEQATVEKAAAVIAEGVRAGDLRDADLLLDFCRARGARGNVLMTALLNETATVLRLAHLSVQPASDLENPFLPRLKNVEALLASDGFAGQAGE